MCRIAGIASPDQSIEELQHKVASMCYVLRHGGPDDEGVYASAEHGVVLGHRRLSLLDLQPSGHQPMHNAQARYTVTYNGEVYNYVELREELAALGYRFRSSGDTEVILAAFAYWGDTSFARLNGMFAFALFDNSTGELYLVRDAMGIKPLYYTVRERTLVFASEVRAFAQRSEAPEPNPDWPVYLMAYGFLPEPITTLKDVQPLGKGTFLKFNTYTGQCKIEKFEQFVFLEKTAGRNQVLEQIQMTLQGAVKRHLLADARIGVFLSGGIDSSIVSLLAAQEEMSLNTVSIDFTEEAYSEKVYQESVLQNLRAIHYRHLLTEDEFHLALPEILDAMDLPSSDGLNTWFISKIAAGQGLKAVLSGLGGDELFGGYPSFERISLATALQSIPAAALRAGRYSGTKKLRRLVYLSLPGAKGQYLFLRGHFTPASIARYLDASEGEVWNLLEEEPVFPDLHYLTPGNRASWVELNVYMQNQLLRDADCMSMAHGLEIRTPFLDKAFVKLVLSVSSTEKYKGPLGKQLLIDTFKDILPPAVWQRKKMGFSFPFQKWLKGDEWVRSKMYSGGKASQGLLAAFDEGTVPWSGLLISLLLRTQHHDTQPAFFNA